MDDKKPQSNDETDSEYIAGLENYARVMGFPACVTGEVLAAGLEGLVNEETSEPTLAQRRMEAYR